MKDDIARQRRNMVEAFNVMGKETGDDHYYTMRNTYIINTAIKDLKEVINKIVDINVGIHPAAVEGVPRTEFEEGWNKAVIKIMEEQSKIFKKYGIKILDDGVFIDGLEEYEE